MKRISLLVIALVFLLALSSRAQAADNTISFDSGQPTSPAAGKITATGTYTSDPAWTVSKITLIASRQGGQSNCQFGSGNWSGSIINLPGGTYNVFARMLLIKGGLQQNIDTETKEVMVAAP